MKKKQTDGDWDMEHDSDGDGFIVKVPGKMIAHVPHHTLREDYAESDARLISAAPDLLYVAKLCLEEWDRDTGGALRGELIARLSNHAHIARCAIKKAEGI